MDRRDAFRGPEHLDDDFVAGYDRKQGYDPASDLDALARHGVGRDSTVLDLGAGTGKLAVALAPRCKHVTAVDVSPAMVAAIRARRDAAAVDNVTVVQAGFLSYDRGDTTFDAVFTRNALHQLPDFWKGSPSLASPVSCGPAGSCTLTTSSMTSSPATPERDFRRETFWA